MEGTNCQDKSAFCRLFIAIVRQAVFDVKRGSSIKERSPEQDHEYQDAVNFLNQYSPEFVGKISKASNRFTHFNDPMTLRRFRCVDGKQKNEKIKL